MFNIVPTLHNYLGWMIDLETLATDTNAVVTEVSIVGFEIDSGKIVSEKTWKLSVDEQIAAGRSISSGTLAFWLKQSQDARDHLLESMDEHCNENCTKLPISIHAFLEEFRAHILINTRQWEYETFGRDEAPESPEPRAYGNGPTFDLGKIASLYAQFGDGPATKNPIPFYGEVCVRTLVSFCKEAKSSEVFEGIPHYGLDDCKHQIKYVTKIYNAIQALAE